MKSYDPKEMDILLAEARRHQECIDEEEARTDRRASITIRYDPDNRIEAAETASIVRGDTEALRTAIRNVHERLRRVARGKDEVPGVSEIAAEKIADWIFDELDGIPLSLEG